MGNIDLFNWNEICYSEGKNFKNFLKQKLFFENIKSNITNVDSHCIQIEIYKPILKIFKIEKKSGTLCLDEEEKTAVLNIEGIERDRFSVKKVNNNLILYEPELKYRFRETMPHFNVQGTINKSFIISTGLVIIAIILFALVCTRFVLF